MVSSFPKRIRFLLMVIVLSLVAVSIFAITKPPLRSGVVVHGDYSEFFTGSDAEVIVYGFEVCEFCSRARAGLTQQDIRYEFRDIRQNDQYARDFSSIRATRVPMLLTEGGFILGYNDDIHEQLLILLGRAGAN